MGNFTKIETGIEGLVIIDVKKYGDHRGYFKETYQKVAFEELGLNYNFVQENESYSKKNTLRGLHFQIKHPQGKLVRVVSGVVYDVGVDLRPDSKTYGKWFGVELSGENGRMFYVPEGFAHGFLVKSDEAVFTYKCTDYYHPEDEGGIIWNDPTLAIDWQIEDYSQLLISDKDKELPSFK